MATSLEALNKALNKYKKSNPDKKDDPYSVGRHTYCHLILVAPDMNNPMIAEVRSWRYYRKKKLLSLGCVNWTHAAGTCTIELAEQHVGNWHILEDNPTLRILYGKS